MARHLGSNAHLVSYGAMSKEPLSLPTSLFIFKGLTCHGFWQSKWYKEKSREEREALIRDLVELIVQGKVRTLHLPHSGSGPLNGDMLVGRAEARDCDTEERIWGRRGDEDHTRGDAEDGRREVR